MEHVEIERKYDVAESAGPISLGPPFRLGGSRTHHLVADYIDTLDHALTAAGYSLRRRTGGGDEGWHLKFPREGDTRRELHAPLSAGATTARVPPVLRDEVSDVVELDALVPVARLVTIRTERDILRDDVVVAALADDRVHATTPRGGEQRWREVEVELAPALVTGDPAVIEAIGEQLAAGGLRRSASSSKISRALEVTRRDDDLASAGAVVLTQLRAQAGTLQALEEAVRRDEPDAVHTSRVATRRLRSTLRTYRRLFHRDVTDPIRDEIKWLGELLGAPRDAEVLQERILADLDEVERSGEDLVIGPVRERLASRLGAEHRDAHEALVRSLGTERHLRLMGSLVGLLVEPPLRGRASRSAKKVLPTIAARAEGRVERARAQERSAPDEAARLPLLHEVRKKAKAARYAYDVLVPLFGDDAEGASKRWERVTDDLGELQDTIVVTERLRDLAAAAESSDESAFTYGLLVAREQERGRVARASAEQHLDDAPGGLRG